MIWQDGIHQKNIEIGRVIRHNHVGTFWNRRSFDIPHMHKGQKSNTVTPHHIDGKTVFPPIQFQQGNENQGVKNQ